MHIPKPSDLVWTTAPYMFAKQMCMALILIEVDTLFYDKEEREYYITYKEYEYNLLDIVPPDEQLIIRERLGSYQDLEKW